MRALAFIMASYILALVFMPCADNPDVHVDEHGHSMVLADVGSPCGDHHHNPEDACSPLCFCNCCHTHVNHEEAHFYFSSIEHQTVLNSFYNGRETSSFVNPPLRPPQV